MSIKMTLASCTPVRYVQCNPRRDCVKLHIRNHAASTPLIAYYSEMVQNKNKNKFKKQWKVLKGSQPL